MLPDLDSLALFVRAAEARNLTRAADATCITVPAASRRLSLLEHQFKVQLFERHSRGLELTLAGHRLLQFARTVIADVHHMRSEMTNYTEGHQSLLRVHGNTSSLTQFLPRDLAEFQASHPQARIMLEECRSEEALQRVRNGEIDLGVVADTGARDEQLHFWPYRQDRLCAVVRQDDAFNGLEMSFIDLLERDLVGLEGNTSLTRLLEAQASQLHHRMALRVQVRSFDAVCRSIEAGLGVGVLPLLAARSVIGSRFLRTIPLSDLWAHRQLLLCTRASPAPGSALATLVHFLHACQDEEQLTEVFEPA